MNKNTNAMKNTFKKNTGFDHFSKVAKSLGIALFFLIASDGFAQSGTILVNGGSVPISSGTKFPIWLPGGGSGQTINIGTNVTSISGILYNITPSTAGGNIMTVNSVVYITGATSIVAGTALKVEGILFATTSSSTSNTWNIGGNTPGASSILGTTDNSPLSIQSGTGALNIGQGATSGAITIGGATQTGGINIGTGTGGQSIKIGGSGSTVSLLPFTTAGVVTNTAAGLLNTTPTLPVANGGTGDATLATGAALLGAGTGAVTTLSGTGAGQLMLWNGTTWSASSLTGGTNGFWTLTGNNLFPSSASYLVGANNLAGSGYRTVYATPSGTLATSPSNTNVFTYTSGNQTFTVPSGITSITVKMWGGGGGGGYHNGWNGGFSGGGGGYTQGTIAVSSGQVLTVMVGGGGLGSTSGSTLYSYGGGAPGCTGGDCAYSGQGGGRSAIIYSGADIMTAGGGGGGGSSRGQTMTQYGGAGGGLVGQDGTSNGASNSSVYSFGFGMGGGQNNGGLGAQNMANNNGLNGSHYTGGTNGVNSYGGGGGGGWYGGGGGGYSEPNTMGGAGGGSGYIGGSGVSNAYTLQGYYLQPPKTDDINYILGVGVGGYSYSTAVPLAGGNGLVVIYY
jgi:hypothetical protein